MKEKYSCVPKVFGSDMLDFSHGTSHARKHACTALQQHVNNFKSKLQLRQLSKNRLLCPAYSVIFLLSGVFCTNNAQAPSLFSNVTLTSRRSYVTTYDRLLVSVTLEKREGACALFVQKTPDMFTNLPSARKTLLYIFIFILYYFYFIFC